MAADGLDLFVAQLQRVGDSTNGLAKGRIAIVFDADAFELEDHPDETITGNGASAPSYVLVKVKSTGPTFPAATITGDLTVGGTITQAGTQQLSAQGVATSGNASATLLSPTLPSDEGVAVVNITLVAIDSVAGKGEVINLLAFANTFGGSLTFTTATPTVVNGLPLAAGLDAATWDSGTQKLSIKVKGPNANITAGADNGGGKLRLTLTNTADPDTVKSSITGVSVTVAGLSGTPGGNGAHTATYVDGTHIDLLGVNYVAPDVSGTVVETTPRALTWSAYGVFVESP